MPRLPLQWLLLVAIGTGAAPIYAKADWHHAHLRSAEGTTIDLDFQVTQGRQKAWASPVWLNVANAAFNGNEQVDVIMVERVHYYNYANHNGHAFDDAGAPQYIDLAYTGDGHFTGFLPRPVQLSSYPAGTAVQTLTLIVDGQYLTDPINGTTTFQVDLGAAAGL